ncbi:hypothetical protein A2617_01430 [Candidatus Daviesbacteria bacterium RIFOXYD1_FULL_41_10]|uniref:Translation elongation factor-like protein n=2 Tax=Candidatus Daviesiibacteriota TaxID=1752718 RepID=A0A1F5N0R4_9BACT|nr:MAG: hypothetical protein UU67_C0008G0030 [Candidatus Daviesbacteria bacterium GW2011_GWB1_41_5]OGE71172.1 MAG: hypothetical protein A2617_01430 [Candidatus Daviesbacteria bacterium RIFOXYD1_FULL_41_10]
MDQIGKVTHYYDKLGVAIVGLSKGSIKVGDSLKFQHGEDEFTQKVESLQIERESVDSVKKGDAFGLKVDKPVKPGYLVFAV